jgi:hypothetical protein
VEREEEFMMSEEQSPAEKIKFRISYWRNLFLVIVFSCCLVVFGFWVLGEIFDERETQSEDTQPTQKLFPNAPELDEETSTPHAVRRQETLSDGSTRLVDLEVGYEMILPPDWQLIPLDEVLYDDWKASYLEKHPEAAESIDIVSTFLQEGAIVLAFSFDPAQSLDEHFSILVAIFLKWPESKDIPLETAITDGIEGMKEIDPNTTFFQPECKRNFNGVDYCEVLVNMNLTNEEDELELRGSFVIIKVEDGVVAFLFGTPTTSYPAFVDTFNEIINSIKVRE